MGAPPCSWDGNPKEANLLHVAVLSLDPGTSSSISRVGCATVFHFVHAADWFAVSVALYIHNYPSGKIRAKLCKIFDWTILQWLFLK